MVSFGLWTRSLLFPDWTEKHRKHMVSEHPAPVPPPPHSWVGGVVKNDKKINTLLKVGHMFEAMQTHMHTSLAANNGLFEGRMPPPSTIYLKLIDGARFCHFGLTKKKVYLLVNCPKRGMLSSDPSKELIDTE